MRDRVVQIHGIVWHTNEWGTQRVVIRDTGHSVKGPPPHYTAWKPGWNASYVKIWRNDLGRREVVDRALTVKRARERIREMRTA